MHYYKLSENVEKMKFAHFCNATCTEKYSFIGKILCIFTYIFLLRLTWPWKNYWTWKICLCEALIHVLHTPTHFPYTCRGNFYKNTQFLWIHQYWWSKKEKHKHFIDPFMSFLRVIFWAENMWKRRITYDAIYHSFHSMMK